MDDSIVARGTSPPFETFGQRPVRVVERPAGLIPKSSGAVAASNVDVTWGIFFALTVAAFGVYVCVLFDWVPT